MSSFQMESLKFMEKFDGGNFHLWKFKMRMMLSKHGLWKFVDGSATVTKREGPKSHSTLAAYTTPCVHVFPIFFLTV
jgi:hypothetical protein